MNVYFGGPDKTPCLLRDLLAEKISQTETCGEIFFVTYYFRDFYLAEKLIEAANRGVKVSLVLEKTPRVKNANIEVYNMLKSCNNINIRYVKHRLFHKSIYGMPPKIHEKIYYFSSPKNVCYIGSFNPSGRINEDPAIIKLIGDQDRGHNFLVEITNEALLNELYEHCNYMYNIRHGFFEMLKRYKNKIEKDQTQIYFFPWANIKTLLLFFNKAESGDNLMIAESHFTAKVILYKLIDLAKNGVKITIISHDTKRRFPLDVENILKKEGIEHYRYMHPEEYPMHNKFILLEKKDETIAAFGSLNFTIRSLYENHETFVVTKDNTIIESLKNRWHIIFNEVTKNNYNVLSK